ncbi:MAG: hypothetical protein N2Z80_01765 [Hydrogenothermaceae bacterium]|nr:hypothetical protein [Hydrogenothermaceae bacterium]
MKKIFLSLISASLISIPALSSEKPKTAMKEQKMKEQKKSELPSGKGVVVYKVDGDPADIMIALKGNLEASQIVVVTATDPTAPLVNNISLFPDCKKLKVDYIQNFLVTSISTLYKVYTTDPNAMALSPLVITVYQYEGDDKTYIVRTRPSLLLDKTKYPDAKKAIEELENRIDKAIKQLM